MLLFSALEEEDYDTAEDLIPDSYLDWSNPNYNDYRAIHIAVTKNKLRLVEQLIAFSADVDVQGSDG